MIQQTESSILSHILLRSVMPLYTHLSLCHFGIQESKRILKIQSYMNRRILLYSNFNNFFADTSRTFEERVKL